MILFLTNIKISTQTIEVKVGYNSTQKPDDASFTIRFDASEIKNLSIEQIEKKAIERAQSIITE